VSTATAVSVGRVGFVGGGFMGEGIVQGLIGRSVVEPGDVRVCEVAAGRRAFLAERYGINATGDLGDALADAHIIVLAVKPQDFEPLAHNLVHQLNARQVVVSIMAGVPIRTIHERLQHERIVRAMPNTPGATGAGFTVWTATADVPAADLERVEAVLGALGRSAYFADEKYLDMATAVSGSGPGFVMLMVEAMIDAAVLIGFKRDLATDMVLQTFAGSISWARATGLHPAELRNAVTSAGGTTAAGLQAMERAGVRAAIGDAVVAALERSRALGG
jgi:pyrroline-5-carboxylate reductase